MYRKTFTRIFRLITLPAMLVGLLAVPGIALASHVEKYDAVSCASGHESFCQHGTGGGDGSTGTTDTEPYRPHWWEGKDPSGKYRLNSNLAVNIVAYQVPDTTYIAFYLPDGTKLGGLDKSFLDQLAASGTGRTLLWRGESGKLLQITYLGDGSFRVLDLSNITINNGDSGQPNSGTPGNTSSDTQTSAFGSVTTTVYSNGMIEIKFPNGTVLRQLPDRSVVRIRPDRTMKRWYPDGTAEITSDNEPPSEKPNKAADSPIIPIELLQTRGTIVVEYKVDNTEGYIIR